MLRHTSTVLLTALLALAAAVPAQNYSAEQFRKDFNQGLELSEDKLQQKAIKRGPTHAIRYFEELWFEYRQNIDGAAEKCDALTAAWEGAFGNPTTMEKIQRWADGATAEKQNRLTKIRNDSSRLWTDFQAVQADKNKGEMRTVFEGYQTLAKSAEGMGHYQEASELWGLAAYVASQFPQKTIEEREEVLFATEQQLAARDNWGFTFDQDYQRNKLFVKSEAEKIEADKKDKSKRKAEGYDADAKGLDALLMPNAKAEKAPLKFAALKDFKELDYGPKNGPLPFFWWSASLGEQGTNTQVSWFQARTLYMHRLGANKFAIGFDPNDTKKVQQIAASPRPKPTTFYLADDKQMPYAMFFWYGSDREMCGFAECNYAVSKKWANIYYRSAASWKATHGKTQFTFYDDNASGRPGDADPFERQFNYHMLGDVSGDGLPAPLFDSMKIGKGKRVPFSRFVKLDTGWHAMETTGADVSFRPLNPEYVKTGKVKMAWSGPKPTAPDQLVIQGKGDYTLALFDVAGGKEVEVPAGEYQVIFGRIVHGKGARTQSATLWPTDETKTFVVKAGETFKLEMGAPFKLDFRRDGGKNIKIDALSICVAEKSGCKLTEFHGIPLDCTVFTADDDTGKGKKEVGEFQRLVSRAAIDAILKQYTNLGFLAATWPMPKGYREGEMLFEHKVAFSSTKIGLFVKKHPFFKTLETVWK